MAQREDMFRYNPASVGHHCSVSAQPPTRKHIKAQVFQQYSAHFLLGYRNSILQDTMDPFAALGAAAAIAQFIEQGIKLVNGAREIHKSAFGSTAENKRLGTVIQELKIMSERLVSKRAPDEQSEAEQSLSDVALECQILSEKILELLEKTKAKDPNSLRQSAVAALKSAWNDSEKKELVEQVERCRNMMHTQLTVILGVGSLILGV